MQPKPLESLRTADGQTLKVGDVMFYAKMKGGACPDFQIVQTTFSGYVGKLRRCFATRHAAYGYAIASIAQQIGKKKKRLAELIAERDAEQ